MINILKSSRAKTIFENIFLVFFCVFLFLSFQQNTFLDFGIAKVYWDILLVLLLCISIFRLFITEELLYIKIISLVCLAVYLLSYYLRNMQFMAFLGVITFGCLGIDYKKILKCSVVVSGSLILITIFMYLSSLMPYNSIYILFRDGDMRSGLGLWYPTGSATMILIYILSIYVVYSDLNIILQIFLGLISLFFASIIMNSKTSMICSIIYIMLICNDYAKNKFTIYGKIWNSKEKYYKWLIIFLFPILAVIMYILVIHYGLGYEYAKKLNTILHSRLSLGYNAFKNYSLLPFGDTISLVGGGAVAYEGYNYIDSSYMYIPYMNGYLIYIITCLSVMYMTYKAYKIRDKKFVIAIIVILVNSFMEERLNHITFDIFIILPLAKFAVQEIDTGEKVKKYDIKIIICAVVLGIIFLLFLPTIFAYVRTFSIMYELFKAQFITFFIVVFYVILMYLLFHSLFKKKWIVSIISLIIFIITCVFVNKFINDNTYLYDKTFKNEDKAMNIIIDNHKEKIYVCDLPVLYKRRYKDISYSILNQYELALLRPNTVIMPTGDDSNVFHGFGYYICYISKDHMIYTLDEAVVKSLKDAGYEVQKYNYINRVLNRKQIAYENKLTTGPSDCIYLDGSSHSIKKGPNEAFTYSGNFEMECDIEITDMSPYATNDDVIDMNKNLADSESLVCDIIITTYNGKYIILHNKYYVKDFVDKKLNTKFNYYMKNVVGAEYKIIANDGYKLKVNNISYRRTD